MQKFSGSIIAILANLESTQHFILTAITFCCRNNEAKQMEKSNIGRRRTRKKKQKKNHCDKTEVKVIETLDLYQRDARRQKIKRKKRNIKESNWKYILKVYRVEASNYKVITISCISANVNITNCDDNQKGNMTESFDTKRHRQEDGIEDEEKK